MEKFNSISDIPKQPEHQSTNTAERFWNNLGQNPENQIPEISKKETAMTDWWNNLGESIQEEIVDEVDENHNETREEASETDALKNVTELQKDYIEDLKNNSEYPETINDDNAPYEKLSPEKNAEMREEFTDKREDLIKGWEEKNEKEWPRYKEDIYDEKTGKLIRREGDRYDAHHIHPLTLGGKNEAGNITPMHVSDHYDKRGVHAPDSPYDQLEKHCKEEAK